MNWVIFNNGSIRLALLAWSIACCSLVGNAQIIGSDFKNWKGIKISYPVTDKSDSLSSNELTELRSENGLPLWFEREMYKVVCLTGECRMVHLWLYWDGSGNYLGFHTEEKDPLTKTDHHDFSADDYKKLHSILNDSVSVLKNLKQDELITLPEKKNEKQKPDAYSGATRQSLQEYLVRNAAYTCYTLWHTVYGPTRQQIITLLVARSDAAYLKKIFTLNDPAYLVWAIRFVSTHPEYRTMFENEVMRQIGSERSEIAHLALAFYSQENWKEREIQVKMAEAVGTALSQIKFEIIWKFSKLPQVSNDALLLLLQQYEKNKIYAGLVGYVCEMIHAENLMDSRIKKEIKKLSRDKNPYVKDLAKNLLSQAKK